MGIKTKLQVKRKVKKVHKGRKHILTSLDWIDIEEVNEDHMVLKRDKSIELVYGIKIEPHPIFLDSGIDQVRKKNQLRFLMNRFKTDMYHAFVFNPINLDVYYQRLMRHYEVESDSVIQEMIMDDIAKAESFQRGYRELEFFIMIKGKPGTQFYKLRDHFFHEFRRSNIKHEVLNKIDFQNYIASKFENQVINDVFYSTGVFDEDIEEAYNELTREE